MSIFIGGSSRKPYFGFTLRGTAFLPIIYQEMNLNYVEIPLFHFELFLSHRQKIKVAAQMFLLAHFEAALDFSRSEFTCS